MVAELTICTALRVESAAVRAPAATRVVRTGMGPRRAARSLGRLGDNGPVAMLGVAGGVAPTVQVGDVVVATEVRHADRAVTCPSAPLLAGELRRAGFRVHLGPIATSDSLLGKEKLAELASTGVLAVDMESAVVGAAVGGERPFAVVRVVTDTIAEPIWRPDIVGRGWRALRTLRAVVPFVGRWAAAAGERSVHLASPRSFCAGVERAIEIVERALDRYGAPVYVRRQIVHNAHIVGDLQARGAIFVEELDEVPVGARVILAAHGVTPAVRAEAVARRLQVVDATCPLVAKVHAEVRRYAAADHTVFLIGHGDHEEVVGTVGEAPDRVVVVDDLAAASRATAADADRVAYVMQTTLAVDEAEQIAGALRSRYPQLVAPRQDDICYATSNRQLAVRDIAADCDVVLLVGSTNSSNSLRLVEVAERAGVAAYLVDDASDVRLDWITGARSVGITAGASAPPRLVDELVGCLGGLGTIDLHEHHSVSEDVTFTLPREVS
ncbi:MAG: 4-hydroxy-3-methylbut-2-en-yl diphosphate reductase [Frankiaceae bacterium]|nr:4-hydroxy-3-methylbut-2-en-yl diphosphate reductase [Frankiaceae bacterium]